jgi:hypothetical protein
VCHLKRLVVHDLKMLVVQALQGIPRLDLFQIQLSNPPLSFVLHPIMAPTSMDLPTVNILTMRITICMRVLCLPKMRVVLLMHYLMSRVAYRCKNRIVCNLKKHAIQIVPHPKKCIVLAHRDLPRLDLCRTQPSNLTPSFAPHPAILRTSIDPPTMYITTAITVYIREWMASKTRGFTIKIT